MSTDHRLSYLMPMSKRHAVIMIMNGNLANKCQEKNRTRCDHFSPFEEFIERSTEGEAGSSHANVFLQSEIFHLMFHPVFT